MAYGQGHIILLNFAQGIPAVLKLIGELNLPRHALSMSYTACRRDRELVSPYTGRVAPAAEPARVPSGLFFDEFLQPPVKLGDIDFARRANGDSVRDVDLAR